MRSAPSAALGPVVLALGLSLLAGCPDINRDPTEPEPVDGGTAPAPDGRPGTGAFDLLYTRWVTGSTPTPGPELVLGSFAGDTHVVAQLDGGVSGVSRAAVSPDGARVAYTTYDDATSSWALVVRALAGGDPTVIGHAYGFAQPSWSPDGTRIAFASSDEGISVVDAAGGPATLVAPLTLADACTAPRWSRDGSELVFADGLGGIFTYRFAEKRAVPVVAPGSEVSACAPTWSPDGQSIAYAVTGDPGRIARVARTGGAATTIAPLFGGYGVGELAWSPDGRQLAFVDFDDSIQDGAVRVVDAAGGTPRILDHTNSGIRGGHPVWSPDGTSLLYLVFDDAVSNPRLWIVDVANGARLALPHVGAAIDGAYPAWLPAPIVIR
ncbi:MAG: hypothetical protein K8W52_11595 [Deltaproteobacteria bacterium]|nr:hypothetical protein [Deltaproteobacteria bacterium]